MIKGNGININQTSIKSVTYDFDKTGKYTVYATYKDITGICEITVKEKDGWLS